MSEDHEDEFMKHWEKVKPNVHDEARKFLDGMTKSIGIGDITDMTDREVLLVGDTISGMLQTLANMMTEFWEGTPYDIETNTGDQSAHPDPIGAFHKVITIASFLWGGSLNVVSAEMKARGIKSRKGDIEW